MIPRYQIDDNCVSVGHSLKEHVLSNLLKYGAIVLQDVDVSTDDSTLSVAGAIGSLKLGIDENLSGPMLMNIRYDSTKTPNGQRPAYFTDDFFPLHTDLSYVPNPPRFLLVHCLHPAPAGEGLTLLSDCAQAFDLITKEARLILASRVFSFAYPPGCLAGNSDVFPVYLDSPDYNLWRFRKDGMSYPEDAVKAVAEFQNALEKVSFKIPLKTGDLLIVDNHRVAHGRTAFGPDKDGQYKRHLRRVYAQDNNRLGRH